MTRTRRRAAIAALIVVTATIGVGAGTAAPAFAGTPASQPFCPPVIAELGVQYNEQLVYDLSDGPYVARIVGGAFPGVDVTQPHAGVAHRYTGAPTKLGVNTFTIELSAEGRASSRATCTTKVFDSVTLDPATLSVDRIEAPDRYAESVAISERLKPAPATAPLVYLASGEGFADALSGAAVAAQREAPLLLSTSASLPSAVAQELTRLAPADIVILGGEATVKPSVVAQLQMLLPATTITRIGGQDRYEVSRNIINDPEVGARATSDIFVASGRVFADALSATPAAVKAKSPVLLVDGQEAAFTAPETALLSAHNVEVVTFLGGVNTISASLGSSLDVDPRYITRRISGADRYYVSSGIALRDFVLAPPKKADTVYISTGSNYPDALAGGVLAAVNAAPIVLAMKDCIPADAAKQITQLGAKRLILLGGINSLGAGVASLTVCSG